MPCSCFHPWQGKKSFLVKRWNKTTTCVASTEEMRSNVSKVVQPKEQQSGVLQAPFDLQKVWLELLLMFLVT